MPDLGVLVTQPLCRGESRWRAQSDKASSNSYLITNLVRVGQVVWDEDVFAILIYKRTFCCPLPKREQPLSPPHRGPIAMPTTT